MIVRLILACTCVAGAFRPDMLPLRAPAGSHAARTRAPAPVAFTLLEEFKERMTQMTDLRVARASHILLRKRPADAENGESSTDLLTRWKQVTVQADSPMLRPPFTHAPLASYHDVGDFPMHTHAPSPSPLTGDRGRPRGVCQVCTRALGLPEPVMRR